MKLHILLAALFFSTSLMAQEAKIVSECIVTFDLTVDASKADPALAKSLAGTTKTVFIKGSKVRSELTTPSFQQTIIFDSKTDTTVVLRELGNTKYMSFLDANKRAEQFKKYDGIVFAPTSDTKTILGYECKKIVATLRDGSTYSIFYAPSIVPSNKMFEFQFREVPGFVLEYETLTEDGKLKVLYSATKISLTPVPAAKFDLPRGGYRVL